MDGAERAQIRLLPDGRRLHLQDGPIDLIVEAVGARAAVEAAYRAAASRVSNVVLDELCAELPDLRAPGDADAARRPAVRSRAAWRRRSRRMRRRFITPMAAVAGAVADEILAAMRSAGGDARSRLCQQRRRHRA